MSQVGASNPMTPTPGFVDGPDDRPLGAAPAQDEEVGVAGAVYFEGLDPGSDPLHLLRPQVHHPLVVQRIVGNCSTAIGLLISSFVRSQVAAAFGTAVLSILPAVSFSGMLDPVSSLQGIGRLIGEIYPTSHFLVISRGTFSKGLGFAELWSPLLALALAAPLLSLAALALLRKQAR